MAEETSSFNIWSGRDLGVNAVAAQAFDSVSESDIEYFCNCTYPFLQLVNVNAVFGEELPLNFVTAPTGWVIHDYGEAISTAAPHVAEQKSANRIIDQVKTTEEIAKLIVTKGWTSVEIIAGTREMKRFIWIEAKRYKFDLIGYTPSVSDEKCYDRLAAHARDLGDVWENYPKVLPKPQEGVTIAE